MSTGTGEKKGVKGWAGGPPPWAVKSGDRPLPALTPKSRRATEEGLLVKLEQERKQMEESVLKERARQSKLQNPVEARGVEETAVAPSDPREAIGHHEEMVKYHHQAMAHHFAMMYHHHNLCCEAYMEVHGPEYDLRQYRPDIPSMPDLPTEWVEQNMHLISPYHEYDHSGSGHWSRPCPPTVPPHQSMSKKPEIPDKDPALTDEEQYWINKQIDGRILEEVTRQIEQEEELPELVCTNGGEPSAEDINKFIEQVEVIEAWNAPMTSLYTNEGEKPAEGAKESKEGEGRGSDTDSEKLIKPKEGE